MTALILIALALGIFAGGILMGDHLATRRFNRELWRHQTEMDKTFLSDLKEHRAALVDIAGGDIGPSDLPTVH